VRNRVFLKNPVSGGGVSFEKMAKVLREITEKPSFRANYKTGSSV
jgi:hypothetical protein